MLSLEALYNNSERLRGHLRLQSSISLMSKYQCFFKSSETFIWYFYNCFSDCKQLLFKVYQSRLSCTGFEILSRYIFPIKSNGLANSPHPGPYVRYFLIHRDLYPYYYCRTKCLLVNSLLYNSYKFWNELAPITYIVIFSIRIRC